MDNRILKYHKAEVVFILLILSSELETYDRDQLVSFTEAIEGRIEEVFTKEFIENISVVMEILPDTVEKIVCLKELVVALYAPQWNRKLGIQDEQMRAINFLAKWVLDDLNIPFEDPIVYASNHLELD